MEIPQCCFYTMSDENTCHFDYKWCFFGDCYASCTNGNRNEYSTVCLGLLNGVIIL